MRLILCLCFIALGACSSVRKPVLVDFPRYPENDDAFDYENCHLVGGHDEDGKYVETHECLPRN